jgi:hypothetical protein
MAVIPEPRMILQEDLSMDQLLVGSSRKSANAPLKPSQPVVTNFAQRIYQKYQDEKAAEENRKNQIGSYKFLKEINVEGSYGNETPPCPLGDSANADLSISADPGPQSDSKDAS